MILVKLEGGLGNQMFQYALGRKLSLQSGTRILLDINLYTRDIQLTHPRMYGLSNFNIRAQIATEKEIRMIQHPYGVFWHKLRRRFERRIMGKNNLKFDPSVFLKKGDVSLEGFWQSEKYFKDIRDTLLADFSLKKPLSPEAQGYSQKIAREPQSVSLHVRRTDYVANEKNIRFYGSHCDQEYYTQALAAIAQNTGRKDLHVFVFSDDIKWVKENIDIPYEKTYVPETAAPDYERVMLMSLCKYHIIANSTFSWWGAWLDNKAGRIVVAPSIWIPGIDLPVSDIIPPEWIKI